MFFLRVFIALCCLQIDLLLRSYRVLPSVCTVAIVGHIADGYGVALGGEDAWVGVVVITVICCIQALAIDSFCCYGESAVAADFQCTVNVDGLIPILAGDGVGAGDGKIEISTSGINEIPIISNCS